MSNGFRWGATRFAKLAGVIFSALALADCSIIPKDGPTGDEIRANAETTIQPTAYLSYALVHLTPLALDAANRSTIAQMPSFKDLPSKLPRSDIRIGKGDIISVTVYEAATGGLFIPPEAGVRAGNFVQIPSQQVDGSGYITIPYAGNVKASGLTARDLSGEISHRLAKRAIEPQAVVTINERRGNDISILGEVNLPVRFAMDPGGIRILSAIARAGGPRNPAYETVVTVQRGATKSQAVLSALVKDPRQDIQLAPGDVVFVSREPKTFMVFGATPEPNSTSSTASTNSRRFLFDSDNLTLAEGLAKAGGLAQERADPRSVFLLRYEKRNTLRDLGVDVSLYVQESVPTIYAVDLSKSDGFFLMNDFYLRHRDMIVVADSASADLMKLLNLMNNATAIASNIRATIK
jgi:polysaccharide export outer membrane protein